MALRPAPKRKIDLRKLDELQKEIFGSPTEEGKSSQASDNEASVSKKKPAKPKSQTVKPGETIVDKSAAGSETSPETKKSESVQPFLPDEAKEQIETSETGAAVANWDDLETIADRIASSKAGQGRNTTRPFSLPRTLIIDTTRLKAKFRTIDEQFTQNVIIDFLLREALTAVTPENYRELRAGAFESIKRADETTRRSLTVTEEVVYQMSELKAGINLETGKKFSNDEIFSTLLAIGVSWLYRNGILN